MTHPLIPEIITLATPVAQTLDLEVVGAILHTHQAPPILRVDIRNPKTDTSLEDCERMSQAFDPVLESSNLIPDAYVLEISSPGVSETLASDRDFISFKSFTVKVQTQEPYKGQQEWLGQLIRRDQAAVHLSQKGRAIAIPRALITHVQLIDQD